MSDSQSPRGKLHDPEKLRRKRIEAGLNQMDLAAETGIQQSHISRLERGESSTTPKSLARLARALGCTIADLLPDKVAA